MYRSHRKNAKTINPWTGLSWDVIEENMLNKLLRIVTYGINQKRKSQNLKSDYLNFVSYLVGYLRPVGKNN